MVSGPPCGKILTGKEERSIIFENLKDWLSSKLGAEEEEEKTAEQALGELIKTLGTELKKCKRQVGIVVKSQDKLKQQINRHTNIVTKLQVEILKAAGGNQDERARDLIRKRKRFEQTLQQLKRQLNKHKSVSDTIQETVRKIELKIEEARRKKLLLATQRQAYETSKRLTDGLHGEGGNLLEEIDDDVTFLQTETRLALDIDVDRIGLDDFETQLDEHDTELLEARFVTEDEELAQLKQRLDDEKDDVKLLPDDAPDPVRRAEPAPEKEAETAPGEEEEEAEAAPLSEPEEAPEATQEAAPGEEEASEPAALSEEETEAAPPVAEDDELAELKRQLAEQGGEVIEKAQKAAEEAQARVDADGPPEGAPTPRAAGGRPPRRRPRLAPQPQAPQDGPLIIDDDGSDAPAAGQPDLLIIDDDGGPPAPRRRPQRRRRRPQPEPDIVFIDDND